jgi:hypothetical protein
MSRSRVARSALAAVAAGVVAMAPVPAVAGALHGSVPAPTPKSRAFFGLGPATQGKIDGRAYFFWSATPYSSLADQVVVVNFGIKPVTVRLFVTNAYSGPQGVTGFLPRGQAKGGPASWITVHFPNNSPVLHLAPRSKVTLPISVIIPKNAPPGDHVGAVIAALTSVVQVKGHAKLHLVQQVGVRVISRISCPPNRPHCLNPQLSVLNLRVSHSDSLNPFGSGSAVLSFVVKNTGNELLGGKVTASVSGLFGSTSTGSQVITLPVLLPGGSYRASLRVSGIYPELVETAQVKVVPLVVKGQNDGFVPNFYASATYWSLPWAWLILFIVLVAAVIFVWLRRRRGRRATPEAEPSPELAGSVGQ